MRRVVHLLGGMLLGALLATSAQRIRAIAPQDPVATSPQYYKVLIDNDQVRVLEYRLKPGEKEAMHSHPAGVVRYLADATFRTTTSVGKESEFGSYRANHLEGCDNTRFGQCRGNRGDRVRDRTQENVLMIDHIVKSG